MSNVMAYVAGNCTCLFLIVGFVVACIGVYLVSTREQYYANLESEDKR